jgi:hypothetical protein
MAASFFQFRVLRFLQMQALRDPMKWIVKLPQSEIKSGFGCAACLVVPWGV